MRSCCSARSTRRRPPWRSTWTANADIILGCDWLRAHDLNILYDSDAICLCVERGCTSDRRVRVRPDLTLDDSDSEPASPATALSPAEARALPGTVRPGEVPTLGRPSLWALRQPSCFIRGGLCRRAPRTPIPSCLHGSRTGRGPSHRGLNAITQRSAEALPHVDRLVYETRAARAAPPDWISQWPICSFTSGRSTSTRRRSGSPAAGTSSASALSACTVCHRCGCAPCIRSSVAVPCRSIRSGRPDRAGPIRCRPAGLLRAVCAGALRRHPHLLQGARGASRARAHGARDAAAPHSLR